MTRFEDMFVTWLAPHRRAERLIDARLDARRGELPLSAEEDSWLDEHLAICERCRGQDEARQDALQILRSEPALTAPDGFAARVMRAARVESVPTPEPQTRWAWGQWAVGGAVLAAAALLLVATDPTPTSTPGVEAAGAVSAATTRGAPDFEVRAPSVGAAEVRARFVRIAQAHGGSVEVEGGTLHVRIPREELVGVLQDLSRGGELAVTRKGALDPAAESVYLQVALD